MSHEDNIIGRVTNNQNWGNYIIIKTIYGLYVVLAHLKKDSATVSVGSYVKVGQKLAEVGNSGYSQEPHIHMQVQYASEIGSVTAPFHLINYISNNKLHFHNTPLINEIVESTNVNQAINQALNFKIGEEMLFKMNNEITVKIICQLDEIDGRFYLSDGISKVYYGKIGNQFYFYDWQGKTGSPLYDLIISAPKIPLTYGAKLEYEDDLSFIASKNSLQYFSHFLKEIFGFKAKKNLFGKYITDKQGFTIEGVCNLKSQEIKTFIKLDPMLAISEFMVGERRYNRVS
ncbi:MAG: peptidoglycan DD-metalloendopeptidase family protein [Rickettsiales bacterium]|nr:peptidoglycan DD-metalloendopeptidase family protein [Rickettsiales bacterium]